MTKVAVIGAGIVGLSTASFLQRYNYDVTIIDPLPPGSSTSYGNSGMLTPDGSLPMALPGMLRKIPRWLRDPYGPLYVQPSYFPKAAPWLIKWAMAGRMDKVRKSASALRSLHKDCVAPYKELLGSKHFNDLVRQKGQIHLWDTDSFSLSEKISEDIRKEHGIETKSLTMDELKDMVPNITSNITRALFYPNNCSVVNPLRLSQTLAALFSENGGTILQHKVLRITSHEGNVRILTNCLDLQFDKVVVASGAWSHKLIRPLGYKVPLETERGYHMQLKGDNSGLEYPLLFKSRGFSAAPMEMGLRLSGTVEIAGLDMPPKDQRGEALLRNGSILFPGLKFDDCRMWMGFRPSIPDSLPVLGQASKHSNVYFAFGHGHLGLSTGAISGKLVAQLMAGTPTEIDMKPYSISRFSSRG